MPDSKQPQTIPPTMQRAIDEVKNPELRRKRVQEEFEAFRIAYATYLERRSLSNGHHAADRLRTCLPRTGSDLAETIALLEQMVKGDKPTWARVLGLAIEADVEWSSFARLKKLFRGEASQLFVAKVELRDGKITLSGQDAAPIWQCLLRSPATARECFTIREEKDVVIEQIMFVEANEKLDL